MQRNKIKQIVINFYNKNNLRSNKITIVEKKDFN